MVVGSVAAVVAILLASSGVKAESVFCLGMPVDGRSISGACSSCGRQMPLRRDGNVKVHGPFADRCAGSGLPPAASPPSPPPCASLPTPSNVLTPPSSDRVNTETVPLNPGRAGTKLLGRVPRPVREQLARKLAEILDLVVSTNCRESWERLFLFCCNCLPVPPRRGHRRNLASHIRRAISDENGESRPINTHTQEAHFNLAKDPLSTLAARVAAKLEEGDFRGAVRIASSGESFAPVNAATLGLLKEKHPPRHPLSSNPPPLGHHNDFPEVSPSQVRMAIQSFPSGSAGGPDGLRPQHLKDLVFSCSGLGSSLVLDSLTRFVNFALSGEILKDARPYFFGASLIALNKSCGGIRPIAVGCTLRRLAAKCASLAVRDEMGPLLAPLQLGYGTPLGAEAAVHAARTYLHHIQPGHLLLKVDFRNAFNCIRRDKMLHAVREQAPGIYDFVHSAYSQSSLLFFGDNIIESAEGVQQGDPLGPLLFSLTIHPILKMLKSELRIFYLDDGTMGGNLKMSHVTSRRLSKWVGR